MALEIRKGLLHGYIQNLYDESLVSNNLEKTVSILPIKGVVDDQFYQMQLRKRTSPDFVVRAITNYCDNANNLFTNLTYHINKENVDFQQVDAAACELHARTTIIGAPYVKWSCAELRHACQRNDKEYCSQALYWMKNEFAYLRRGFDTILQMERGILDLEMGHLRE